MVWARVTQGEPRFAPRPIEASQPEPVRREWTLHRANTGNSPARLHHAEMRSLLIEYSDRLARTSTTARTRTTTIAAALDRRPSATYSWAPQEIYIEQGNGTDTAPRGQIAVTVTITASTRRGAAQVTIH